MSLFDELDIAGAADNPWVIPANTYACVVSNFEAKATKAGDMGAWFYYTVTEGEHKGFEISEFKRLPSSKDANPLSEAEKSKATSYIKQRLASLGVPESRMNSVTKEDLVGIECYVSTKIKDDFVNVRFVSLTTTDEMDAKTDAGLDPFA